MDGPRAGCSLQSSPVNGLRAHSVRHTDLSTGIKQLNPSIDSVLGSVFPPVPLKPLYHLIPPEINASTPADWTERKPNTLRERLQFSFPSFTRRPPHSSRLTLASSLGFPPPPPLLSAFQEVHGPLLGRSLGTRGQGIPLLAPAIRAPEMFRASHLLEVQGSTSDDL